MDLRRRSKKETWKKELMAGNFQGNDSSLVENICCAIESLGGDTLHCYIADLSDGEQIFWPLD